MASSEKFLVSLQSKSHAQLLDIIDQLRSYGISSDVPLPQIIFCGDQSSGKSSVLEAVSGVRFPMKDSLCTRFATELVLRRGDEQSATVAITPGPQRNEEEMRRLLDFQPPSVTIDNFPDLVESAKEYLGIDGDTRAFSDDVLRVIISGPDQPHLTLVDLPGVIHAENKQQSEEELVRNLVQRYMENPRSIILAVVSASNDYANQIVTKLARECDPPKTRTLGIITKPDTLFARSESEAKYVELAKNKDVEFRLGWHVLRNRGYDSRECSIEKRNADEKSFFSKGVWASISPEIKGVGTLKPRLSNILKDHITRELPNLTRDIQSEIAGCKKRLGQLGDERVTIEQQRLYLIKASQSFRSLVDSAVNGTYQAAEDFFGDPMTHLGFQKRLRACVADLHQAFADEMRWNGEYEKVIDDGNGEDPSPGVIRLSDYLENVREFMRRNRGCELPGTFNPLIIGDLFRRQSKPWDEKVEKLVGSILSEVRNFIQTALDHTAEEVISEEIFRQLVEPFLETLRMDLKNKISEILQVHRHGHLITYNHYFTDTIQKARHDHMQQQLESSLTHSDKDKRGNLLGTTSSIVQPFRRQLEQNMDLFACREAFECMKAYYKVTMKTLVDDVAKLGVEQCLMKRLREAFTPEKAAGLGEDLIRSIATESEASRLERKTVTEKLRRLEKGLLALNRLPQHGRSQDWAKDEPLAQPKLEITSESQNLRPSTPKTGSVLESLPDLGGTPPTFLSDDEIYD